MEALQARHKKEQRDLQSQITQKKKSATKRTRKAINADCELLEECLRDKQNIEIAELDRVPATVEVDSQGDTKADSSPLNYEDQHAQPQSNDAPHTSESHSISDASTPTTTQTKKPNRAKARLARRAAEQEALVAQAVEEAANLPNPREKERLVIAAELRKRGFVEKEIRPDGHCLYSAVADQLDALGKSRKMMTNVLETNNDKLPDYKVVRLAAADYIDRHPEDFEPFLDEPLHAYTQKIRGTAEWGGHLELLALACTYEVRISVLQGDGRVEELEPENTTGTDDATIWLAYYRHTFGLGEHYNSLRWSKEA